MALILFGISPLRAQADRQQANATTATQSANIDPVGNVASLQGAASITHNNASHALKLNDDIYMGDTLQTSGTATLGVTFNDDTTFNLTGNARIVIDNYVYEDGGKKNSALFSVTRGAVAFVASAVAKTGDMKISTPSSTLGIRGTTGLIEVPAAGSGTAVGDNVVKLYPDPDGRVGRIDVTGRDGSRLGQLTQAATALAIRPGAGGRFSAVPFAIPQVQIARDQGLVRQVHAAQATGRTIVRQQRDLRLRNPQRPGARQPGQLQRQPMAPPQRPGLQKQTAPPSARPSERLAPGLPGVRQPRGTLPGGKGAAPRREKKQRI